MEATLPPGACQQSHQYIERGLQGSHSQESRAEVHSVRIDQAPRVGRPGLIFCAQRFEREHAVAQKQQFNGRPVAIIPRGRL